MRSDVRQALDHHGWVTRRRVKKWRRGIDQLEGTLFDDETCISIIDGGADEHGIGLVMLTDIRLVLWDPRIGMTDLLAWEISGISAEHIHGWDAVLVMHQTMGQLLIRYGEISMTGMLPAARVYHHFTQSLNDVIRSAVPPPSANVPTGPMLSVADELAKLAELTERGVITKADFEKEKQRLIERPS